MIHFTEFSVSWSKAQSWVNNPCGLNLSHLQKWRRVGTVFSWVGKESHHIKEGGWLCVNKTRLLLNILKHDLKSDLQSCCQETEEVSCLFYKLPMFFPSPCPLQSHRKAAWWMGEGLPAPKTPCNRGCGQAVTSACHSRQDKELQNMLGAKGPWLAPHSAQSHRYPCSLGHICYTHGPLMTFISCVSDNVTLLVEWQCSTGQETALAGKWLPLVQAAALLGST